MAASAPTCQFGQLVLHLGKQGLATGHEATTIVITNSSRSACELRGDPTFQMLDADSKPIPTADSYDSPSFFWSALPIDNVLIGTGKTAIFDLGYTDSTFFAPAVCPESAQVEIGLPGISRTYIEPWQLGSYGTGLSSHPDCGAFDVSPILAPTADVPH